MIHWKKIEQWNPSI